MVDAKYSGYGMGGNLQQNSEEGKTNSNWGPASLPERDSGWKDHALGREKAPVLEPLLPQSPNHRKTAGSLRFKMGHLP